MEQMEDEDISKRITLMSDSLQTGMKLYERKGCGFLRGCEGVGIQETWREGYLSWNLK